MNKSKWSVDINKPGHYMGELSFNIDHQSFSIRILDDDDELAKDRKVRVKAMATMLEIALERLANSPPASGKKDS